MTTNPKQKVKVGTLLVPGLAGLNRQAPTKVLAASGDSNILHACGSWGAHLFNMIEGNPHPMQPLAAGRAHRVGSGPGIWAWDLAIGKTGGEDHDNH